MAILCSIRRAPSQFWLFPYYHLNVDVFTSQSLNPSTHFQLLLIISTVISNSTSKTELIFLYRKLEYRPLFSIFTNILFMQYRNLVLDVLLCLILIHVKSAPQISS